MDFVQKQSFVQKISILTFVLFVALVVSGCNKVQTKTSDTEPASQVQEEEKNLQTNSGSFSFTNPKKSAHYVSNSPQHGSVLGTVPGEVVVNFNFNLVANSTISVQNEGQEYGEGAVAIASDRLSMSRKVAASAPVGLYTVNYSACWPDGSCHTGSFQFAVKK